MKPDWDKLMAEFKDSTTALVADVDCTADGKALCNEIGVRGYPSIKHGDPNNLEDYKGGRDLASLKKFAEENLGPTCGPANLDLCDDAKKADIEKFSAMSAADLESAVQEKSDAMEKLEKISRSLWMHFRRSIPKPMRRRTKTLRRSRTPVLAS